MGPEEDEIRELTTTCAPATEGNELLTYETKTRAKKSKKKLKTINTANG